MYENYPKCIKQQLWSAAVCFIAISYAPVLAVRSTTSHNSCRHDRQDNHDCMQNHKKAFGSRSKL